jgi:hypothetical protein
MGNGVESLSVLTEARSASMIAGIVDAGPPSGLEHGVSNWRLL